MKKNYKKLYGYAIIMIACVLVIVLIAALSENRLDGYKGEYEEAMTVGQKQIRMLEEEIVALTKENSELKRKIEKSQNISSELVTAQQAMSDLKDIYEIYKQGDAEDAKNRFEQIEPIGFDDLTLNYYEILKDVLNK